jgi:alpha-galactosidase
MTRPLAAPTPPMGWNSWDAYGASVTEDEVVENAYYMALQLKAFGWEYVVVDIQWYEPHAVSSAYRPFVPLEMDAFSRLMPAINRFPSAVGGRGFGPLADTIHGMGLQLGIHAMRGIPRQAVHQNTAILGTDLRARDIAANNICPWNTDMYGVNPLARGAAEYYRSVFALYASWGVDLVKVDDMLFPYAAGEIELIRDAIDQCGRPMVLSLSCGPIDVAEGDHVAAHAEMWRMSGDFWDSWDDLVGMFEFCRAWSAWAKDGHWPDADMLPVGRVALRSNEHGLGDRLTRFTPAEQVTMLTLWCLVRSPLMLGCHLPSLDPWTLALLTNADVLGVLRRGRAPRQVLRHSGAAIWASDLAGGGGGFLALFNTGFYDQQITARLASAGLPEHAEVRDLWAGEDLGAVDRYVTLDVPSHGARLLEITTRGQ